MKNDKRPKLVAETDERGRVTHVWISMPDRKCARPVSAADISTDILAASEYHGATKREISAWLRRNMNESRA